MKPLLVAAALFLAFVNCRAQYLPTWESIDSRPLPIWYDQAKIGIFINWGVYTVPSFGTEWFWQAWKTNTTAFVKFMKDQYPPSFTYQDFAKDFDAYMYDPKWWADLIKDAGAKYVVYSSKHHEGYTLWPSSVSFSWNSKDVGPNRDLLGEFASALRNISGVHFGVYHSLFEWYNPLYLEDKANEFKTRRFVDFKAMPELMELVNVYKPEVIWSDGDWEPSYSYWNSTGFLAWLYNDSPVKDTVVVNDRWGANIPCHHGGFYTCEDRYNPRTLVSHKWENCYTLDKYSWGYRRDAVLLDFLTDLEVITVLAETVSCGGNLLMNIAPRKDGRIDPLMEERIRHMGQWLRVNGEAIYESQPWIHQNETDAPIWYTAKQIKKKVVVYAILLEWPRNGKIFLSQIDPTQETRVSLLGFQGGRLSWQKIGMDYPKPAGIIVDLSPIRFNDMPSTIAWVLKLENLAKSQQKIHPVVVKNYFFQ